MPSPGRINQDRLGLLGHVEAAHQSHRSEIHQADFVDDSVSPKESDRKLMRKFLHTARLALVVGLAGCADTDSRPPAIQLRTDNVITRRATLSILRRAWDDRPVTVSENHSWYERRLLDRSAYFGRKIRNTETYREACNFWMSCVRDHVERYDDDYYRR